jgi:PAS domain S-box-containing protein
MATPLQSGPIAPPGPRLSDRRAADLGALLLLDRAGQITSAGAACDTVTGYPAGDLVGRCFTTFYGPNGAAEGAADLHQAGATGRATSTGWRFHKSGRRFWCKSELTALWGAQGLQGFTLTLQDLTPSDEPAETLDQARYRTLFERAPLGILYADPEGRYIDANESICQMLGYERRELIGQPSTLIVAPVDVGRIDAALEEIYNRADHRREWAFRRRDGSIFTGDVIATLFPDGTVLAMVRDVTADREHEIELARVTRLYNALSHINQAIVWSKTREELFQRICRCLVEQGGFDMAWIGWHDPDARRIVPQAQFGDDSGYLESTLISVEDCPAGRGPTGTAFRTGRPAISNDAMHDPRNLPWLSELERRGVRASAAFPVRFQGEISGTLSVYAGAQDFFKQREIALLEEAAADLSFAIDNFAREEARRHAEETLRSEKQFSDTMIESMPGALYFYDGHMRFLRWNRNFEEVTGYSGEEVAQLAPLDFFRGEDQQRVAARIAEVFEHGESAIEAAFVAKDGTSKPYFFTGRRVQYNGMTCLVGVGIDVSARREAEARLAESERKYRELVENANSIILRWSSDGRITFLNEFGQRFFGYTHDEIVGKHVLETIVPATESGGRDLVQLMADICAAPESYEQNINENVRRNGQLAWVAWTNRIVRDASGKPVEILSIGADVTQKRILERQLQQAQKMEAVGRLAGGVAHDFNNLLTVISGYSELLLGTQGLDADSQESVKCIRDAGERAAMLTRQLLGFSRQTLLQPRVLDLNKLVADTEKLLRRLIGEDIALSTRLASDLDRVTVDPGQLNQVLMNLAVNARDAMPKGGQLTIETANVQLTETCAGMHLEFKPGPHVMLAVTDTGCGMTPEVQSQVFEPFFTTKEVGRGTGLGMSMVLGIVQQSNGCIHVYSELGQGTSFKIYLPAVIEAIPVAAESDDNLDVGGTETVLLVEDDALVRGQAVQALEKYGYRVLSAVDGEDALRMAEAYEGQLDLILTDVVMPRLSGPDLAAKLKVRFPQAKVLYMSGYTDDAVVRHGLLQGQVAFVQKPYTWRGLARKVRTTLGPRKS